MYVFEHFNQFLALQNCFFMSKRAKLYKNHNIDPWSEIECDILGKLSIDVMVSHWISLNFLSMVSKSSDMKGVCVGVHCVNEW
jgi:hypothetical protein